MERQIGLRDAWLQRHNVPLDTTLDMRDMGVSAYRGKNAAVGALKAFMTAIEQGKVQAGDYFIIENLDRLSRNQIMEAVRLFTLILEAGIKIVTLSPERAYSKESINASPFELFEPILVFIRANEESSIKSSRSSKNWERRQKQARDHGTPVGKTPS